MSRLQTRIASAREVLSRLSARSSALLGPLETRSRRAPWLALAVFALLVSYVYTDPAPPRLPPAEPEAHGDGLYYYAYLRSLVFDHDVDFSNDYRLLGDQFNAGINPITKRPQNVFTVGPSLFWMPLVPAAELAQHVSEWLGAPPQELDGTESMFQRIVLYGSTLAGLLTTALGLLLALRLTDRTFATLAAIGMCVGSPLIWFMLRQPSFSHASDACAVALFVSAWLFRYGSRAPSHWLGLGALLGFSMLVRPQNIAHAILPFAEWTLVAVSLIRANDERALLRWVGTGVLFVLAIALAFSPLLLIWRSMYGVWTLVPQGADFMDWRNSRWDVTLFSSRSGLFAWHPLILLSVVGLFVLACSRRYARELRLFAALGIVVLLTQSYINGAAKDWWGGWAFGGRRFLSCTVYFMAGLAVMLETLRRFVVERPARFAKLCAAGLLLCFALYNRSLADDYLHSRVLPDGAQSMKPRYGSALIKTLDEGYAWLGNPGSWPANLWFALRTGSSPEMYDVAAAKDLHSYGGALLPMDEAHAVAGFEPQPSDWGGHRVRIARGRDVTWVFALRRQVTAVGLINVAGSEPNTRIRMSIDGKVVLNRRLSTELQDYEFKIPDEAAHAGLVVVKVEQTLPSKDAFVVWQHAFLGLDKLPEPAAEDP